MSEYGNEAAGADAWRAFEHRLTRFLTGMLDGEVLILSDATDQSRYVQFLSFGSQGSHAEVSTGSADVEVERLGWQPPRLNWRGKPVGGSPNFAADALAHEVHRLSAMAVGVLRDAWRIAGPDALTGEKVNDAGGATVGDLGFPA